MKCFLFLSIVLLVFFSLIVVLLIVLKKGVFVVVFVDFDFECFNVDSFVLWVFLWYSDIGVDGWINGFGYSLFGNDFDLDVDVCYFDKILFYLFEDRFI